MSERPSSVEHAPASSRREAVTSATSVDVVSRSDPTESAPSGRPGRAEARPRRSVHEGVRGTLLDFSRLYALVGAFALARVALRLPLRGIEGHVQLYGTAFLLVAAVLLLAGAAYHVWTFERPNGEMVLFRAETWRRFASDRVNPTRVVSVLLTAGYVTTLLLVFLNWKADIGVDPPFRWDEALMRWDRIVHGGRQPWEWLRPLVWGLAPHRLLELVYGPGWTLIMMVGVPLAAAIASDRILRFRYLFAFGILWILIGTVLARLLASAGPVYFERLTGDPAPYGALVAQLRVNAWHWDAMTLADWLWSGYRANDWPRVGISAMPSMHVSIAVLAALWGWARSRALGVLLTGLAIAVQIGSVALAWHYALDGYVAAVITLAVWWTVGRLGPSLIPRPHAGATRGPAGRG